MMVPQVKLLAELTMAPEFSVPRRCLQRARNLTQSMPEKVSMTSSRVVFADRGSQIGV
jgi:hypothetical protein